MHEKRAENQPIFRRFLSNRLNPVALILVMFIAACGDTNSGAAIGGGNIGGGGGSGNIGGGGAGSGNIGGGGDSGNGTDGQGKEEGNTPTPPNHDTSPFGVTAGSINYYMAEIMLIDAFKQSGHWVTKGVGEYDVWDTKEQGILDLDENGWVKSLNAKGGATQHYNRVGKLIYKDTRGKHVPGKHIVLYEGEGVIGYHLGATKIDSESSPGRDVVNVSPTGSFFIVITETNPENYIRNIRVIKPGGICNTPDVYAENAEACKGQFTPFEDIVDSQIFHPYFIEGLKPYRLLRGMDIQATTQAAFSTWDTRPKLEDSTWSNTDDGMGNIKGAPFEILVTYANISNSDLWVNIPGRVDDTYVTNMAKYIKEHLNPNLKVYTEYYDEAWNTWGVYDGTAGSWMSEQGAKRWPDAPEDFYLRLNWYGMRTMEFCKLFKTEFGKDSDRVKCTMNSQAANTEVSKQMLGCPLHVKEPGNTRKDCTEGIDYLSIAPYFGGYLGENANWRTVANWDLDTLFKELEDGSVLNIAGGLPRPKKWMEDNKKIADEYKVGMIAYEGGQHLVSFINVNEQSADGALMDKLTELFIAANRDPRMGDLYKKHLTDWKNAGGELYITFTNMSQYGRWGSWGNKESRHDNRAYKAKAIEAFSRDNTCWWPNCDLATSE